MTLPNDKNSLLVPMAMDAWVNSATNTQNMALYYADYNNLQNFQSPIPAPFSGSSDTPARGIHLHWALPDALTHGVQNSDGSFDFPLVPNRWLVVRTGTNANSGLSTTAWVIQSDGQQSTQTPGAGPGAFLDPNNPSGITSDGSTVTVNGVNLGITVPIENWQGDAGNTSPLFLQAVGPGNISFAAYKPFVENVFSIVDTNLPAEDTGNYSYSYSYLVVGWYSNPEGDPLTGVSTYVDGFTPNFWDSQADWQSQTAQERFDTILNTLQWSLPAGTDLPTNPPNATLYHSFIADVAWPPNYNTGFFNGMNTSNVQIAIGNTAIDALSALIQSYANNEGQQDPNNSAQWITAGNTLCSLIQAASLDLLDDYGVPGGSALVQQQIEQSWFGTDPGGTVWRVVSAINDLQVETGNDNLTPAQNAALLQQLSKLNRDQLAYDQGQSQLQTRQSELYRLWLKLSQSLWDFPPITSPDFNTVLQPVLANDIYPTWFGQVADLLATQTSLLAALPDPTDNDAANTWANTNWTFPDATDSGATVTLASLGLQLKGTTANPYWHPTDPVVLVVGAGCGLKYGEDGSFTADGTLCCRLPGQTVTGISVNNLSITEAEFTKVAAFTAPGTYLNQYPTVPAIPSLLVEAFFSDPQNAGIINQVEPAVSEAAIKAAITALLDDDGGQNSWVGTPPSPIGYDLWQQAWSPILLEWQAKYYPSLDSSGEFDLSCWTFDGSNYQWNGNGYAGNNVYSIPIQGRTVVTPYAQTVFQSKLSNYLSTSSTLDTVQMEQLLDTVMSWDILGQTLSGFTDQLTTLLSQETFPPPSSSSPSPTPLIGDLVQDQYHLTPKLTSLDLPFQNIFFPVRGGLVTFAKNQLWLLDSYGQYYDLSQPNTLYGFQALISPALTPPAGVIIPSITAYPFVLGPRLAQSARLDMTVLANDNSGDDILTSANSNPICGWLLPNYLDNSIAVYDSNGIMLGELLAQQTAPANWRPRPGSDGNNLPPPASPAQIANQTLNKVVTALANQGSDTLSDFMQITDETLWMVNPVNGMANDSLAALIGRPLAVVSMQLNLTLNGDPITNQLWNSMLTQDSTVENPTIVQDSGGVLKMSFPVRLGSLDLRDDGLIGYFLSDYAKFYAVHTEFKLNPADTFIQPILETSGANPAYQGDVAVTPNAASGVRLTLILDPQGCVHAYTGILPVNSVALDANTVQEFLKNLLVNFQTGPTLADPGTLRTPQPAGIQGVWSWTQAMGGTWEQDSIVDTDDTARFPTQAPSLREGWLQLFL